jgi:hypothetical protein
MESSQVSPLLFPLSAHGDGITTSAMKGDPLLPTFGGFLGGYLIVYGRGWLVPVITECALIVHQSLPGAGGKVGAD